MKIFITGATGFIGSHLISELQKRGYNITALVRNKSQKNKLESINIKAVIGDIVNPKTFQNILKQHEIVIHLAALRSNWDSQEKFRKINSEAIKNLFIPNSKLKHVIITSSVYAIGNLLKIPADEHHPLKAHDLYGKSKILAEEFTKKFSQKYKIPFTIIRPAIVYGQQDNDLGMVIKMIKFIKQKKFPIIGTGKNLLHLIYIDDLVNGYTKAIEIGGHNKTYILAGEKPIRLIDLVNLIKKELNTHYDDKYIPKILLRVPALVFEKIYEMGFKISPSLFEKEPPISNIKIDTISNNWYYDISKAKKELEFRPLVDYELGIKNTIKWFKKKV